MKINKWIALVLIALLGIGAMGLVSYRVFASSHLLQSQDCAADSGECEQDANEAEEASGADSSDETAPVSTGITAEEAQSIAEAANPGAATLFVEFDRGWGRDIWEVELDNDLDVQVDANTGEILGTEQRD